MPLGRFDPCPNCCEEECQHCNDTPPNNLTASIDGLTDSDCENCEDTLNGQEYVLQLLPLPATCWWVYDPDYTPCGLHTVQAIITEDLVVVTFKFYSYIFTNWSISYSKAITTPIDCDTIDEELTYHSHTGVPLCASYTTATVRLVA